MITITDIANEFETVVRHFNSIESLSLATREVSVQHGRDILEKMRVLADEEGGGKEKPDLEETQLEMAEMLLIAAKAFLGSMAEIARSNREKLADKDVSPVFEKTVDGLGRVSYKLRNFVIDMLIRQGKNKEADEMRAATEQTTPDRFKSGETTITNLAKLIEAGIMQAEILEKRIAEERKSKRSRKNDEPSNRDRILDEKARQLVSEISGYHTIVEVNRKDLIPVVQKVNTEQEKSYNVGPHVVTEVNKEKLVTSAQEANKGRDRQRASEQNHSKNN